MLSWRAWAAGAVLLSAAFVGCEAEPAGAPSKPPDVDVSTPVSDRVADYEVFTGRVQTMHYLDLKARVTGYLEQINFQEGDDVTEGQVLFRIDSRPYDATLAQAVAQVNQASSHLQSMQDVYARDLRSPAATPEATLIQDRDNVEEARAAVEQAKAQRQAAQNNVDYCVIKAPFSGRISRRNVDPNNDVIADNTVLATLVQLNPLYAYFDVDERTLLRIGALLPQGKIPADAADRFPLTLGLANESPEEFKHKGRLRIADNRVDATTGTLRMWGTFDNLDSELKPGLFVRVRMDVGRPHDALFISESALGSDQGRRYLYVVVKNDQGKDVVAYRRVEVGQHKNGLIAVNILTPEQAKGDPKQWDGLLPGEMVVVNGLQRLHADMEISPTPRDMTKATAPPTDVPVVAGGTGPAKKG